MNHELYPPSRARVIMSLVVNLLLEDLWPGGLLIGISSKKSMGNVLTCLFIFWLRITGCNSSKLPKRMRPKSRSSTTNNNKLMLPDLD